jgi:hypothetical protein
MLIYCYEPVELSYEAAVPAFLRAVDEQEPQSPFRAGPEQLVNHFLQLGNKLSLGAVTGKPTEESGRVAIPVNWSTEDPSAISMTGEVTLSRLRPGLCHLSLNSFITGRLAAGLMYNRSFQMSMELAVDEFLNQLAGAVLVFAKSDTRQRRTDLEANRSVR